MIIGGPPDKIEELKKQIQRIIFEMKKGYESDSVISGFPGSFCVNAADLTAAGPFLLVRGSDVAKAKLIGQRLQEKLRMDVEVGRMEACYGSHDGPIDRGRYEVKGTFIVKSGSALTRSILKDGNGPEPINLIHEDCGGGQATAEYRELVEAKSEEMANLVIECRNCRFRQTILTNPEMRQELALVVKGKLEEAILGFGIFSKKCIIFKNLA